MLIRHPLLRAGQAALSAAAIAVASSQPKAGFVLAVLGEREQPDGSWEGADLLRNRSTRVDRFQLDLVPDTAVQVRLERQLDEGGPWLGVYEGPLEAHREYALPSPHAFFAVQGSGRIRLTVAAPGRRRNRAWERVATRPLAPVVLPLSDGAPSSLSRRHFEADGEAVLELPVLGR
jgi:hypothetical protein